MGRAEQHQARPRVNESKEAVEQAPLEMPALEPVIAPMLEAMLQTNQSQSVNVVVRPGEPEVTLQMYCGPELLSPKITAIDFILGTVHDEVHLTVRCSYVEQSQMMIYAETEIRRNRLTTPELPPHSGIVLYRAVLDFFQDYANTHNRFIEHTVHYSMEMPFEKWGATFLPTLEEYGYSDPFTEDLLLSYRKIYEPENESL